MQKAFCILIVCLLGSTLSAQIFPRIEKQDVKRRVATGATETDTPETPDPEPETVVVDGEKALKRYDELLAAYVKEEYAQKKAMTKHVDDLHASVRDYLEGVFMLRLGMYKDAARKLDSVGLSVKRESEIKTGELLNIANEIKKGSAYYYRMVAVVMQEWGDFETEEEAIEAWKKASDEATEIRTELQKEIKAGRATSDSNIANLMTAWLLTAKRQWVQAWKYEQNVRKFPESPFTWQFFIASQGSRQNNMKDEYTPNYLKQRAALQVMKEFFPHTLYVSGGSCDTTLAINYLSTGQLDEIEACLKPQEYHSLLGRAALQKGRKAAEDYEAWIEKLKN